MKNYEIIIENTSQERKFRHACKTSGIAIASGKMPENSRMLVVDGGAGLVAFPIDSEKSTYFVPERTVITTKQFLEITRGENDEKK